MKIILSICSAVFFLVSAQAQVVLLHSFDPETPRLIVGPESIDGYHPEQSTKYLEGYLELKQALKDDIDWQLQELEKLNQKKIPNTVTIESAHNDTANIFAEMAYLDETIMAWQKHQELYEQHQLNMDLHYYEEGCFNFIVAGDTVKQNELSIQKIKKGKFTYYEFMKSYTMFAVDKKNEEQYTLYRKNKNYIPKFSVGKLNLERQHKVTRKYFLDKYKDLGEPNWGTDDLLPPNHPQVIIRMEKLIPGFKFDLDRTELFRAIEIKNNTPFYLIRRIKNNKQVLVSGIIEIDC